MWVLSVKNCFILYTTSMHMWAGETLKWTYWLQKHIKSDQTLTCCHALGYCYRVILNLGEHSYFERLKCSQSCVLISEFLGIFCYIAGDLSRRKYGGHSIISRVISAKLIWPLAETKSSHLSSWGYLGELCLRKKIFFFYFEQASLNVRMLLGDM